jgi:hypothetical protein
VYPEAPTTATVILVVATTRNAYSVSRRLQRKPT